MAAFGDGKVYLISSEHSLNAPPYAGAEVRCINATAGAEIWKLIGMANWQEVALADGYFVFLNLNDMRIYAVGPGPRDSSVSIIISNNTQATAYSSLVQLQTSHRTPT